MIGRFSHKGLKALYEQDSTKGVNVDHVRKLRQILSLLEAVETIEGVNVPMMRLHPLKGDLKGFWAVTVRANWRVIFKFENGTANEIDLTDYH